MTLGDGILWSTVLILLAAGIYTLSIKKKWKTFGKVVGILTLIGAVIGGGIWGNIRWANRPNVVQEFEGIKLGMRPVDVTLLKGEPDNPDEPEKSEDGDYYTLSYFFNVKKETEEFLFVAFNGNSPDVLSVRRVCRRGGYGDLLGIYQDNHESAVIDKLGEPTSISIQNDGLAKFVNYEQWNVAFQLRKGRVQLLCMTSIPMTFTEEYGDKADSAAESPQNP